MNVQLTMPVNYIPKLSSLYLSLLFVSVYIKFLGKGPKFFLFCQIAGFPITKITTIHNNNNSQSVVFFAEKLTMSTQSLPIPGDILSNIPTKCSLQWLTLMRAQMYLMR